MSALTAEIVPVRSVGTGDRDRMYELLQGTYDHTARERFEDDLPFGERAAFALAGYNAGVGHVRDARLLARRQGLDPDRWFGHVEQTMLQLSRREIARTVPHGYCRGAEPVAYVRHIGPYRGDSALFERLFGKLMKWAGPRGLLRFPETKMITVYHDDPEMTDEQKLRIEACLTVPEDTPVEGEIGKMTIAGGKVAVAHFEIAADEYEQAWKLVFGDWLPESGYIPDDRPCYEVYHNDPNEHPEHKHIVDICVPVVPL